MKLLFSLILYFLASLVHPLYSQTPDIKKIKGVDRTSPEVLIDFLWPEGKDKLLKESDVQDLQNLSIFQKVEANSETGEVKVTERWTTIPIMKFQSGGGVSYYTLGVFDPNTLGRLIEVGGQYENLAGQHSGVIWFRKPRLFGRTNIGADIWSNQRLRLLYDNEGENTSGFITSRERFNIFLDHQLSSRVWIGGGADYRRDSIEIESFESSFQQSFDDYFNPQYIQGKREKLWLRVFSKIGRLNETIPFFKGFSLFSEIAVAQESLLSDDDLLKGVLDFRYFKVFGEHNSGVRVRWELTNSPYPEDALYIGGLDRVRGFQDGQFFGKNAAFVNLEHRYRFYKMPSRWLEFQGVGFFDWGRLNDKDMTFSSVGVGLRFISPRVYRFNARVDYAQALKGPPGQSLSFGLQQFF